uniref:Uncharacterized protein n=1 Tax=Arundo donax TaxID=35708 RepID=A0A0A9FK97_ARUDO
MGISQQIHPLANQDTIVLCIAHRSALCMIDT